MTQASPRPAWKNRIRCFVAVVVVGLISSGGTWLVSFKPPPTLPPLLQGLPNTGFDRPSQEWFLKRLKERFPIASSEAELIRELWLEGFLPKTDLRDERRTVEFDSLNRGGFRICRLRAHVSWTTDDKRQLTDIDGDFFDSCP